MAADIDLIKFLASQGPAASAEAAMQGYQGGAEAQNASRREAFQQKLKEAGILSGGEANTIAGQQIFDPSRQVTTDLAGTLGNIRNASRPKPADPLVDLKQEELKSKIDLNKTRAGALKNKPTNAAISPGQKALDVAFGKQIAEDALSGNNAEGQVNETALQGVIKKLETGEVKTGGIGGMLPIATQRFAAKKIADARQDVEKVIFPQLRAAMGAAFTQSEGERVINATFDSAQPSDVIANRLKRLLSVINTQRQVRNEAKDYFNKNGGTLAGFSGVGRLSRNADSLISDVAVDTPSVSEGGAVPQVGGTFNGGKVTKVTRLD